MNKILKTVALALFVGGAPLAALPPAANAQQAAAAGAPADPAVLERGQQIFTDNCSGCHQTAGTGQPPTIPALAGNPHLDDLNLIAGNVHNGKGLMPAFPDLSADEIAAVSTYIRNSWGNSFGGVTADEVASIIGSSSTAAAAAGGGSIWDGVYTDAQDERGAETMGGTCTKCHGDRLNGAAQPDQPPSPAIARSGFLQRWEGKTLAALFDYIKTKMPLDNPGQLTDAQTADTIAHMLKMSNIPAGETELPADPAILGGIVIHEKKQ
jgi:mono/diheme cytochrome c family protein